MVNNHYTLEERRQRCLELRSQGYNCAQSLAMVFDDITGVDNAVMERVSAGLGGGIGGRGDVCGCVTAMAMIEGAVSYESPRAKARLYRRVSSCADEFVDRHATTSCRELKRTYRVSCNDLILDTIEIIHRRLCAAD